jgi:hypothetical protein
MKGLRAIALIIVMIIFIFCTEKVSADWRVGNTRTNAYGAKANIWVPSSPIYLEESGESNWVSTRMPSIQERYWMQTGWRYYNHPDYPSPKSYVEYCTPPCGPLDYYAQNKAILSWGDISEYKVDHYSGTTWCASINGVLQNCAIVRSAPSTVDARSEIHNSSNNELDTQFSAVYYKTSDGLWFLFDQNFWEEGCPYLVEKDQPYYFRNYRGTCIFLPIIASP